ncbi:TetR/AcrR family transcriptional regulator, partial [Eubacterium aggregans]|uniref:TetR/AcrR family transcriptional regulator n=1 Tax=Eubacterium aggregans TaxID=81409 RepID=UPI003F347274
KKTTIRSIAREAGINHALAYYHFNGKYDIANQIIDEFHQKAESAFNQLRPELAETDPLLHLLTLYRFSLREIYDNARDFDFYVEAYQQSYYDADLVENAAAILDFYRQPIDRKKIDIAVLSTSSSWGQLYTNEEIPYRDHFTHADIIDAIDFMHWSYLGFKPAFIGDKIKDAERLLHTLPIMDLRILEKPAENI